MRSPASVPLAAGVVLIAATLTGCAPKTSPPVAPGLPRFPEFLFPAIAGSAADAVVADGHTRAWNLLQAGDLRRAERGFQSVLKRSPGFFPAETGLAYVELAGRDQRSAVTHFNRALERAGDYVPALVGRGQALLALGREGDALVSFEAALTADASLTEVRQRVEVLKLRAEQDHLAAARRAADAGRLDEARQAYARAVAASPESPFLYRELGLIERRQGDQDLALEHFRRAVSLDGGDARSLVQIGDILEEKGDFEGALTAVTSAASIEPSDTLETRIEALRTRLDLARLPPEYGAIAQTDAITRGELAALIGVRFDELIRAAPRREAVVITDMRGHWAAPWIMEVARVDVMEVFPNHTFQPHGTVRRGDLAQAVSRLLALVAARRPAVAKEWQDARREIADLSPGHLGYPAASQAVAAGVLPLLDGGTFQSSRPVSGAEAVAALERLAVLGARPAPVPSRWQAPLRSPVAILSRRFAAQAPVSRSRGGRSRRPDGRGLPSPSGHGLASRGGCKRPTHRL